MAVVIAVDAGTTGVRAIAFDTRGLAAAQAYREFPQHFPRPGWVEHDPDDIWAGVVAVLAEVGQALDEVGQSVATIGVTVQRETVVAWDRVTGRPRHRAIVWQDRRTAARCEELVAAGLQPEIRRTTGLVLDPYFSATKLEWLFSHGGVEPDPRLAVGTVDSWLVAKLTGGAVHVTDVTNASRTMLLDIRTGAWSDELCDRFGVPAHVLPEVRPSSGRVGVTTAACPLGAGIPISGIAGDQQASLFGQACFAPGTAKNTYGTGSFVLVNMGPSCPPPVDGLLTTIAWALPTDAGAIEITYAYEGAIFVTGAAVQWLRDGLGLIARSADIEALALSVPDSGGVVFVPAFTGLGSPWWDPRARGTVVGITRGTNRGHLARAALDAMALQTRDVIEAVNRTAGLEVSELRADGGAASDLVLQLQADQLGVPVIRPVTRETTALGAAYLAGLAEGVWGSLDDITHNWALETELRRAVDPILADADHQRWRRAVERAQAWAEDD